MRERIIIGEGELAGHPISAPVVEYDKSLASGIIRWRHTGGCFVLEQWFKSYESTLESGAVHNKPLGYWQEVPCVMPEQGKDK